MKGDDGTGALSNCTGAALQGSRLMHSKCGSTELAKGSQNSPHPHNHHFPAFCYCLSSTPSFCMPLSVYIQ